MTFAQTECKTVVHISISPCCPALRLTLSLRWILFPWHVLLLAFLEFSDVLVSLQKWKNWFNIRCSSSSLKNIWWAQCTDMTWQCETKAFFKVCRQAERPSIWIRYNLHSLRHVSYMLRWIWLNWSLQKSCVRNSWANKGTSGVLDPLSVTVNAFLCADYEISWSHISEILSVFKLNC